MEDMHRGPTVAFSDIVVGTPTRPLDEKTIANLMTSIRHGGLISPLVLCKKDDRRWHLVAGFHRHEALRRLGDRRTPFVRVLETDSEYWRHAENFVRLELTPKQKAQSAKFMIAHARASSVPLATATERRRASGKIHGRSQIGAATVAAPIAEQLPTVAQHIQQIGNVSERTAQRYVQIAENVPDEILNAQPDNASVQQLITLAQGKTATILPFELKTSARAAALQELKGYAAEYKERKTREQTPSQKIYADFFPLMVELTSATQKTISVLTDISTFILAIDASALPDNVEDIVDKTLSLIKNVADATTLFKDAIDDHRR